MLSNKVAIVTGASRGIGAKVAKTFAENNAVVIVIMQALRKRQKMLLTKLLNQGEKQKLINAM